MTATLPKIKRGNDDVSKVFCVDVPDDFVKYVPKEILENCVFVNHVFMTDECPNGSEQKAREVYNQYYEEARMIITTRMHAALPCIAAGIPVILAKDRLSHRFPMFEAYTHVYTADEYQNIDWNPPVVEYESMKNIILNASANRVRAAYEAYGDICDISSFYETKEQKDLFIDGFTDTAAFIDSTFEKENKFSYILWAVTQTADNIYHYIKDNYPNANLVAVIDRNKKGIYWGEVQTVTKECLAKYKDAYCFVCAPAAMPEAREFFSDINHQRYYLCWEDKLPR